MKKSKESSKHKEESLEESEEDDDYEQDEFENDSFLVGDDEVEEDEIYDRPRLNLNAENDIGEAELESEVGSSDNEVIYEQQLNKKKSRLKKHRMTEEEYQEQAKLDYANEQHENLRSFNSNIKPDKFIEDEEENENDFIEKYQDDYISRDNRKIITGNKSLAHKIFTRDINEDEEAIQIKPREINTRNILMREDLAEDYMRPEDIEIKKTDVPERILLKFKGCNLEALKQSIDSEADWILEKIRAYFSNNFDNQMVSTKKKIEAVLEFHKKNLDDIPYIVTYRRNIYEPELSPKDIWKIFELDREWNKLFEMKYNLSKAFENIKKKVLPDDRADYMHVRFIENAKSITVLNDMETYIDFIKEMHHEELQNLSEDNTKNLRPNKSSQIQNFRKYNIDQFARKFAFGAYELSGNLEALANGDQNSIVSPPEPEVQPEKLAEDFICPIFDQEIKVMTAGCKFLALELFSFPFIRNYARACFKSQCTISTEPTEEGKKELDGFHPSFRVKRIKNKPIETFNNDLFLDILEAEKKGWITLTVNFGDNFFKDLTEKLNHTYHSKQMNLEVDSVAHGWRVMREETIRIFVAEHCIPYFKKEVRQELREKAENFVLNECAVNFSKMLMTGPYRKKKKAFSVYKEEELLKEEEYPRVLSALYDNAKNEVYVAMLDNSGEILEVCKFLNLMTKPVKLLSAGERDLKREDEEKLKIIIQEHKPDLIVIGANDLKCKYLKEHIGSLEVEGLRESDEHKIWTTYGDITIPRISANCPKVEKLLPSLNYFFRQAVCLARFKQNPLAEICLLWHEEPNKNFCLSLPLHPLQRSVSSMKLSEYLESEAVKVVNSVGVEINKACEHQHLQSVIQFVSGLGPRKANYLIEKINRNRGLLMRVLIATSPKILGDIVFYNCAGFLKVKRSRDSQIYDFNPLDVTRIHPENYPLANKIALSAMDDNFKESSSEAIRMILRDPRKINILDLDEYIKTSQEKGNKYTKFNIHFIKNEFQNPFNDERPLHKDLTSSELFYLLIGDPTFKKGQMVNATVLRVDEEHVKCRLTNDLEATIWYKDIFEDSDIRPDEAKMREMKETFKPGMVVNARVKSINEVNFKIDLTIKQSELLSVKNHMDVNRLHYNYFVLVEEEDYINRNFIKENKAQQNKYQIRNINYPYFKNCTYKSSIDMLRNKEIGAYVFRPSSKGSNFLTLSWKFYDNTYSHIEIQEEDKQPGMQIGKKLRIGSEEYGSLLEITDRYLKPCELLVRDAINSRKFKKFESVDEFENKLKEERENKNYTPYLFTILSEFPQFIIMGHCAKIGQVVKEYIKVKPGGLFFHNEFFPNLEELSNWFKRNYTTESYREYLRRVKAPQVEESRKSINLGDETSVSFDFGGLQGANTSHLASGSRMDLDERNSVLASGAGSTYTRDRNYPSEQRSYRDSGKAGKPCHNCNEIGHFKNECPNRGSRSYNRDYNRSGDSRGNRFSRDDRDFISHKRNRSPNNSEYSGHRSVRREEKQNTWTGDLNQEAPKNPINVGESWGAVDNNKDNLNSWSNNPVPQTNNLNPNVEAKNTTEIGWGSQGNFDVPQNINSNTQSNNETNWGGVSSMTNSENNFNNNNHSNANRNNNFSGYNRDRNFNNNRTKCHNCGEEGHIARNCNNPRRIDNSRRDNQRGNDNFRKPVKCYNCQEDGHFAKDCTKPKNNRDFRSRNESGNYHRRDTYNNNHDNRRDRNNFNNYSNNNSNNNINHPEKPVGNSWGNNELFDAQPEKPVGNTWGNSELFDAQPEKPVGNTWGNSELFDAPAQTTNNNDKNINKTDSNLDQGWGSSNFDNNINNPTSKDDPKNNSWGGENTNNNKETDWSRY